MAAYYKTPEYAALRQAIARCHRPSHPGYPDYGGRGICVCADWRKPGGFLNFLAHVGKRPSPAHSIDRKDNNKGYEPGNVRWATISEQLLNRRTTILVEIDGVTKCVAEWCRVFHIGTDVVCKRLKRGWPPLKAVTAPADRSQSAKELQHRLRVRSSITEQLSHYS